MMKSLIKIKINVFQAIAVCVVIVVLFGTALWWLL